MIEFHRREVYRERSRTFVGILNAGDQWRIKCYDIAPHGTTVDDDVCREGVATSLAALLYPAISYDRPIGWVHDPSFRRNKALRSAWILR